jgi:catalase (peroxidase I)
MSGCPINHDALKSEVRCALINDKVNACPMAIRVAWHASGTYCKESGTGGSDGATMRFEPEATDGANAGLSIIRDMLHPVQMKHPDLSAADLWTTAGAAAVEFTGGPKIPHALGRTDKENGSYCPPNGRLPDASQGAAHLREVFGRMGFNDIEIVALSGAHTLGRCHMTRSGFDGPWSSSPLTFNNDYFTNLMDKEWQPREWDGPFQFEDCETKSLMMLPTDMALRTDPEFAKTARLYADDEQAFFKDFSAAFSKLLALNCPAACSDFSRGQATPSDGFRENAMHGSIEKVQQFKAAGADVHEVEASSGRSALHKAAYWGHDHVVEYLINECSVDLDVQDSAGDTALHDAARFAHLEVVSALLVGGADPALLNKEGMTALQVAEEYATTSTANKHDAVIAKLQANHK